MGKQTVPVAVQAASSQYSLKPQEQPRHDQEGETQGARDVDTWAVVARRPQGSDGEEAAREGECDGDGQGEERRRVCGYSDMPQVQVQ